MNYGVQKCVWTALGDVTANIIQATLVIFVIGSFFQKTQPCLMHLNGLE
jgi:homoserine/homoserine lactone efflux protein